MRTKSMEWTFSHFTSLFCADEMLSSLSPFTHRLVQVLIIEYQFINILLIDLIHNNFA